MIIIIATLFKSHFILAEHEWMQYGDVRGDLLHSFSLIYWNGENATRLHYASMQLAEARKRIYLPISWEWQSIKSPSLISLWKIARGKIFSSWTIDKPSWKSLQSPPLHNGNKGILFWPAVEFIVCGSPLYFILKQSGDNKSTITLVFWLVPAYDLLSDRRTDTVITYFLLQFLLKVIQVNFDEIPGFSFVKSQIILAKHKCSTNWGDCRSNKSNQMKSTKLNQIKSKFFCAEMLQQFSPTSKDFWHHLCFFNKVKF